MLMSNVGRCEKEKEKERREKEQQMGKSIVTGYRVLLISVIVLYITRKVILNDGRS